MFSEVDTDGSGAITSDEFLKFWIQVKASGYKDQDILEELDNLLDGSAWVDFKDTRTTIKENQTLHFPKRPFVCRLGRKAWSKCEELYRKIDHDGHFAITVVKA